MKAVQMKGNSQAVWALQIWTYTKAHCVPYDILLQTFYTVWLIYVTVLFGFKKIPIKRVCVHVSGKTTDPPRILVF